MSTEHESLAWLVATFRDEIVPYVGATRLDDRPQTRTWHCHGCAGVFTSAWPRWVEPTDAAFPHECGCAYLKAVRLARGEEPPTIASDPGPAPTCACGLACEWYGPVGGYSKKCVGCNLVNAARSRVSRARARKNSS